MENIDLKSNLEAVLIDINKKFINIDKKRQEFATHFEKIKNKLFTELRKCKPLGYLFGGFQLGGSYGDNLKVTVPDEFDLVFHIKFPYSDLLEITPDKLLPGNVCINFTEVLKQMSKQKHHRNNYKIIKPWLDESNFLLVQKFQSYFESCFIKVLQENFKYELRYKNSGPAHTIVIDSQTNKLKYSVDFVPGILLAAHQSPWKHISGQWEAVPKPSYNPISFRSSFYRQEHTIIRYKQNLKNALRMMKKFRDAHSNMLNMKSYYIKTLFLWKDHKDNGRQYWKSSLTKLIIDMFLAMEKSLKERSLKYFWDPKLNMYDGIYVCGLRDMLTCVRSCRISLQEAANELTPGLQQRVYNIFCTSDERKTL